MASFILSAAVRAVKSKAGIWKAFDSISDLVPEVTREEWAQAVGEARAALAQRTLEVTRPLNRRPTASELSPALEWKVGKNFVQAVEVYIRDRDTGARSVWYHKIQGDTLRSRMAIVNEAIAKTQAVIDSAPGDYPVDIVGFAYTGTYPIARRR